MSLFEKKPNKDKFIQLRVNEKQKRVILRIAEIKKMSITDYIYSLIEKDIAQSAIEEEKEESKTFEEIRKET